MTLKFCTNAQIHKVNYGPKYRPSTAIAMEILDLEKPRFSVFRQNGGQNYFRLRFSVQIRVLNRRLGRSSPKFPRDAFF